MKKFIGLATVGLVVLFGASPAPAAPSIGGIGRIGGFGGFGLSSGWVSPRLFIRPWTPGYYRPYARASYYYPYAANYPQVQAVDENVVTFRMHVPSDARVWFEGAATSQSGPDRTFVSPSLTPGREYVYHIRVQWQENDKSVERNREAKVYAGDRITLKIDK